MQFASTILVAALAALAIALSAQVEIILPDTAQGIPVTGQTLAVLLTAYFLGRWRGTLAVGIYIALGAAGLPFFSGGESGIEKLSGNTGGYLAGFLLAAYAIGVLGERGWRTSFKKSLLAMTLGTAIILTCGVIRLGFEFGLPQAIEIGLMPFVWGAIIKIVFGAGVAYAFREWMPIHRAKTH